MNLLLRKLVIFSLIVTSNFVHSAEDVRELNIAVNYFTPPFVMRSGNNIYYGFDINMMLNICKSIKRTCKFHSMRFDELLASVESGKMDAAISGITITVERAARVNFSDPYMFSYSRFLGHSALKDQKFTRDFLKGKTVGVKRGSVFTAQLKKLEVKKLSISEYTQDNEVIDALNNGKVDLVLTDDATAKYWQIHSANTLAVLGKPIAYGFGYGVVINIRNKELTDDINWALSNYIRSNAFKENYNVYFAKFE